MSGGKKLGICLTHNRLSDLVEKGVIKSGSEITDEQVSPSSFEPTIGDTIFHIDAEAKDTNKNEGIFRPDECQSVWRTLQQQLPARKRTQYTLEGGFQIKKGFTYLIPLREKIRIDQDMRVKSSPKSNAGRTFLHSRLLADFNPNYDEINAEYMSGRHLDLWLLVQPLAFNLIIHPGMSINQLRIFQGLDAMLTQSEIVEEFMKHPLLRRKYADGREEPANIHLSDGLKIHLDLLGEHTHGIVGLRARRNPDPIDLSRRQEYKAEDYFEPLVMSNGKSLALKRHEYYLFASHEILNIPGHLTCELRSHWQAGFMGPLHFAGFIHNGFQGNLVYEVRSEEISDMTLTHGMPISILEFFRTDLEPDERVYDENSSFQGQVGTKPPTVFRGFDFKLAAGSYAGLERRVLVQDAASLHRTRINENPFEFIDPDDHEPLLKVLGDGFFHSRYDCEVDRLVRQIVPYVIVFGKDKTVACYQKAKQKDDYVEDRQHGKHSVGIGCHIRQSEFRKGPGYIERSIDQCILGRKVELESGYSKPVLVGTIESDDEEVDQMHFALVYATHTDGRVKPANRSIVSGDMIPISTIMKLAKNQYRPTEDMPSLLQPIEKIDSWSRAVIPSLKSIYQMTRPE